MQKDFKQLRFSLLLVVVGVSALILMLWITTYGPGVSSDSTVYIGTAKSLLAGDGFFAEGKPMTHFPPVYPLFLAVTSMFQHGDLLQAGRLLQSFLFGINVVLIGLAVYISTEGSLLAAGIAMLVFLSSAPILTLHSMAWSEALFITFSLAAIIFLSLYLTRPVPYLLIVASLFSGLALTTRYLGVALLLPMAAALILWGNRTTKQKIKDVIIAISIACIPLIVWLIRNSLTAQTATDRSFGIHLFNIDDVRALVNTFYDFILPIAGSTWIKAALLMIIAAGLLIALVTLKKSNYLTQQRNSVRIVLPSLLFALSFTYISVLVISISFLDAHTPLDFRILAPVLLFLTVAIISLAWSISEASGKHVIWWSFILLVFVSVILNTVRTFSVAYDIYTEGRGYTSQRWQNSETISQLRSVSYVEKIYSNGPDVINFLTGKRAVMLPLKTIPGVNRPNEKYEEQLRIMCEEIGGSEAVVAYLERISGRWYLATRNELESSCNMQILKELNDGVIYGSSAGTEGGASSIRGYLTELSEDL